MSNQAYDSRYRIRFQQGTPIKKTSRVQSRSSSKNKKSVQSPDELVLPSVKQVRSFLDEQKKLPLPVLTEAPERLYNKEYAQLALDRAQRAEELNHQQSIMYQSMEHDSIHKWANSDTQNRTMQAQYSMGLRSRFHDSQLPSIEEIVPQQLGYVIDQKVQPSDRISKMENYLDNELPNEARRMAPILEFQEAARLQRQVKLEQLKKVFSSTKYDPEIDHEIRKQQNMKKLSQFVQAALPPNDPKDPKKPYLGDKFPSNLGNQISPGQNPPHAHLTRVKRRSSNLSNILLYGKAVKGRKGMSQYQQFE